MLKNPWMHKYLKIAVSFDVEFDKIRTYAFKST
jgi:hypothetical protein